MTKPNSTLIAYVQDKSGSMASVRDAAISAYNEFIQSQKAVPGDAKITLVQFDTVYQFLYQGLDLPAVPALTHETYRPSGGTALLDAIGRTIIETGHTLEKMPEHERPSKVIVVIQTDGEENSSREFGKDKIKEMIEHQENKYSWEFVFLGADKNAIMTAQTYGIKASNAMAYGNTVVGMAAMGQTLSAKVMRSRVGLDSAWTDEERLANSQ